MLVSATTIITNTVPAPDPTSPAMPASQCPAGQTKCCEALERSNGSVVGVILGLLGVVLEGVETLVGIHCVPIDLLGLGQNDCHNEPVCCSGQDFSGLVTIACVPIKVNL
ncbi:Hydrophobin-3 [Termitomyces sp. J132]|nr:Hydrophobin-3 [Termitomyces sp. J132]